MSSRTAATVILVRDGAPGPEVLLLRRSDASPAFPGAWVFPGGSVEQIDGPLGHERTTRQAAVRETAEETGLVIAVDDLVPWATWLPPREAPIRFDTSYYVCLAPDAEVTIDGHEVVEALWATPSAALERHACGELTLMPPTWMTLHQLSTATSFASLIAAAPPSPAPFSTTVLHHDGRVCLTWGLDRALDITERPWQLVTITDKETA